jgi:arylsulfatase A-like enzyme
MKNLSILLILFYTAAIISCTKKIEQAEKPGFDFQPNILWITCEDMSPRLGCYNDPLAITPSIDRLASQGIRYTNAYSISGVCAPSRSALITGMYPTTIGSMHMRTMVRTSAIDQITDPELLAIPTYEAVPPPEVKCFTEYLRAKGYYCSNNSKEDYQFKRPITAWDESSRKAHWRNRRPGQPFFSVFNFTVTHESQVWVRAGDTLITDPDGVVVPPYYPDTPVIRRDIARHYDNIALMDAAVDDILSQLKADGLGDSTVIFFFSDHGDGFPRAKRWIYDSGIKVPLIIKYPDNRHAGKVTDELVSFVDFAPTVLSLTGIEIPQHIQGQAFAGSYRAEAREYIYAAKDRMDPAMDNQRAVRDKRYKYIRNYMPERPYVQFLPYRDQMALMQELFRYEREGKLDQTQALWFQKTKPIEELYDAWEDPYEVNNLASDPRFHDILEQLRDRHQEWKEETQDWGLIPETELIKRLWPPEGIQPSTEEPEIILENMDESEKLKVVINCNTEGASIGYMLDDTGSWLLYTDPIHVPGNTKISIQAIRIGYKPSAIITRELLTSIDML